MEVLRIGEDPPGADGASGLREGVHAVAERLCDGRAGPEIKARDTVFRCAEDRLQPDCGHRFDGVLFAEQPGLSGQYGVHCRCAGEGEGVPEVVPAGPESGVLCGGLQLPGVPEAAGL